MQPSKSILALAAINFLTNTAAAAVIPPNLTYLFTVNVSLKQPLPPAKLPLGGVQAIEPLSTGSITGPALNGTIESGLAYPMEKGNSFHEPHVITYGTSTESGNSTVESFLVTLEGVGTAESQWAETTVTIGGKYAYLENIFITGNIVSPSATDPMVSVECFCVGCSKQQIKKINGNRGGIP